MGNQVNWERNEFVWNNFSWWNAEDQFLWPEWSFAGSYWIDYRRNPRWVTLTYDNYKWLNSLKQIELTAAPTHTSEDWFTFTADNKIWDTWWSYTTPLTWYTYDTYNSFSLVISWTTYKFLLKQGWNVWKCLPDYTSMNETFQTFTVDTTVDWTLFPVCKLNNSVVFFASWKYLYTFDWISAPVRVWSIPWEAIVWITIIWDLLRVYTKDVAWANWWLYVFKSADAAAATTDWAAPLYTNKWNGNPIQAVANMTSYDVIISWFTQYFSQIYVSSWYDRQLIYNAWDYRVNYLDPAPTSYHTITNMKNKVLMRWLSNIFKNAANNEMIWVCTFWKDFSFQKETLNFEFIPSNCEEIYTIVHLEWKTVITYRDSSNKYYANIVNHNYSQDPVLIWEIVSRRFTWERIFRPKQLIEVILWHEIPTNSSLVVYASADWWAWTTLKTINTAWSRRTVIPTSEIITAWITIFNDIQFKVKLNRWWTTNTPTFYELIATYDDNIKPPIWR